MNVTLLFPDYPTAVAAAKSLGFWDDPEPIYDMVPTGETQTWYHYADEGEPFSFDHEPTSEELAELGNLAPADPFTTEELVLSYEQVGMTEGSLRTSGQTIPESGAPFSWAIDEIGQDPAVIPGTYDEEGNELTPPTRLSGYAVNATGEIPEAAMAYAIPYGSAGRVFAGGGPEPHHYEPMQGRSGYVVAVADPVPEDEP